MVTPSYRAYVDVLVLGPLKVNVDGTGVEIAGAKERTLLAHLVAHSGRVVPVADLIDSLWGEDPPRSAAKALQTYVLRLRNRLEPDRRGDAQLIVTEGPGYRLAVSPLDTDAGRFAELSRLAADALAGGRPEAAAEAAQDALQLWRGPAYAGCEHTAFGQAEAQRLENLRLTALETRTEAYLALDRASAVAPELERLVAEHPLRERLWALLMLAHYRAGGQAEALAAYDRARAVLADELGVDPGPELRALHARVLAQDPGLILAGRATLPDGLRDLTPMVGREAELMLLRDAWRRTCAGSPATVVVRGPVGAGARRLAAALAEEVAHEGFRVVLAGPAAQPPSDREGRPWLLVADHQVPHRPPRALMVVLDGEGRPVSDDASVLDLAPLSEEAVSRIVASYVGASGAAEVAAEILANGPGWPGRVHLEAMRIARQAATQRIEVAVDAAGASRARLASARAEAADGIVALGETSERVVASGACPWRGLAAYGFDDAPWYAGRERLVAELIAHVGSSSFVALVGASGSGKSSALHAGVLAALAEDVLPGSAAWGRVVMRPGRHPMKELARRALGSQRADAGDVLARMLDGMLDGTLDGSIDRALDRAPATRTLLVVDQLEELWTACEDPGERSAYVDTLTELVRDPRSSTTVVVAVRADFVAQAAEHPELAALMADSTVLVGSPTAAEVERAVVRPAARAGLALEDGLAQTLVSDAGSEPGLLPLLSVALTQLWQRRADNVLTYAAYVQSGGIAGAIGRLADEVWLGLSPDERDMARALLMRLAGPGHAGAVTRRRVPLAEVEALSRPGMRAVIDRLVGSRLMTLDDGHIEVAHEALFHEWPRLRGWLTDDAAGRAVQVRLAQAASEWASESRDPALLWTGTRLLSAQEVVEARPDEVTTTERAFLVASQEATDAAEGEVRARAAATARQNRRLRWLLGAVAVFLVLALAAGLVALLARGRADRSAQDARRAAVAADARRLAADALNADRPELGLLMAIEAVHREQSPETYGALLTLLTRAPEVVGRFRVPDRLLRIAPSADGLSVYLTDNQGTLYAVDAETGAERWRASSSGAMWGRPVVDSQGRWLAVPALTGSDDDTATVMGILDPASGDIVRRITWADLRSVDPGAGPSVDDFGVPLGHGRALLVTDGVLYVVRPATGAVLVSVHVGDHAPFVVALGGDKVAVPRFDGSTDVINVRTGDRRHRPGTVGGVSPDHRTVVTRTVETRDGTTTSSLQLRRAATWAAVGRPVTVPGEALEVQWVPHTGSIAVLRDEVLELRDADDLGLIRTVTAGSGALMGAGAAGSDGDLLWVAGRDGTAVALDTVGRRALLRTLVGQPALGVGDADDAGRLAIYTPQYDDRPNPARLVDLATGRDLFGELPVPRCSCQVEAVSLSGDGALASGAIEEFSPDFSALVEDRGRVVLWDTATGTIARVVQVPWLPSGALLDGDHERLLVDGVRGYGVFDVATGQAAWTRAAADRTDPEAGRSLGEFAPDGTRVVVLRGEQVLVADAATGETLATATLHDADALRRVAWSPDGSTLVLGSLSGRLFFLDATTLEPVAAPRVVTAGFVLDIAFSPDSRELAVMGTDGDTTLFDTATWRPYGRPVVDHLGWGLLAFRGPSLGIYAELGAPREISTDPEDWVAAGCRAANTRFTPEESAVILPGEPVAPTCD